MQWVEELDWEEKKKEVEGEGRGLEARGGASMAEERKEVEGPEEMKVKGRGWEVLGSWEQEEWVSV
eukprot:334306-Pelagomonas_calceolata.AAC.1